MSVGVIHERGMAPFAASSYILVRSLLNHGTWP
jgi:hypothetical protein